MFWGFTIMGSIDEVEINEDTSITFMENLPLQDPQNRYIEPDSIFIGTPQESAVVFGQNTVAIAPIETIKKLLALQKELAELKLKIEEESNQLKAVQNSLNILQRLS